jgi:hypothetical protein
MRDWTPNEFEILLGDGELSTGRLAIRVHHRAPSINTIRSLIHAFHAGGDTSGLSPMMLDRLKLGDWTCPQCLLYIPPSRR